MTNKQIWGYSFVAGFTMIFFAASVGNGINHLPDNLQHINSYLETVFVEMLKWAPIYALALLPVTVPVCALALLVLSKLILFISYSI